MKKLANPINGSGLTTGINGLKKSSPFLISLAVAVILITTASVVFTEQDGNYDDNAYTVFGSGVSGSDYEYGESVNIPDTSQNYRLAYSLIGGTNNYELIGWDNSTGYVEPAGDLVIPATIKVEGADKNVTSIGTEALYECTGLISVTIGNSVTFIGESAFSECTGLISVTIGNSVTFIGDHAFSECTGLTTVEIPDTVKSIDGFAFYGCTGLLSFNVDTGNEHYSVKDGVLYNLSKTNLVIYPAGKTGAFTVPDGVTSIGSGAFSGCTGLTFVTIGKDVESIGDFTFSECTELISVTIPDSVTSIGSGVFRYCTGLTTVKISDSVTEIESSAFYGCTKLASVTIPDGVTEIGSSAFYGCTKLTTVEIPDGVTHIKYATFQGCTELTSVTIPDSVTKIGYYVFYGCTGLTSVTIPDGVTSIGDSVFYGCTGLTSVTIPDSVTEIRSDAFYGCTGLANVTIGKSVTSINNTAFSGCTGIAYADLASNSVLNALPLSGVKELIIRDGVTSIEADRFKVLPELTSVTIGDTVLSIGDYAFSGCTKLAHVTIGNSVTDIGDYAFFGCTNIIYADLASNSVLNVLPLSGVKVLIIRDGITSIEANQFKELPELTSVTIGDTVTSIGDHAFSGCTKLNSVTIGKNVTSIGSGAFSGCTIVHADLASNSALNVLPLSGVKELIIRDGVTSIEADRFKELLRLTSVTIGDTVTSIGDHAFSGCTKLLSVTIGSGVEYVGADAFFGCTSLSTISFNGTSTLFETNSFNLGTESKQVTCMVYSPMDDGFLNAYGGDYTTFDYRPIGTHRLYIDPNEGSFDSVPDGWTKDGDLYYKDFVDGSEITIPESGLSKENHTFEWDAEVPSLMPANDITLVAEWTINTYTIIWDVEGDKTEQSLEHGTTITVPDDPVKLSDGKISYEFMGWIGFTEGMTASEDITFFADFKAVLQMSESVIQSSVKDGVVEVDVKDLEEIEVSAETFRSLLNAMTGDSNIKSVSISVSGGSVSLNRAALESLGSLTDPVSVTISEVNAGELSQTILDKVGDRPVYSVNIGDISSFGDGLLTITLKYELGADEDKNNLSVWFVDNEGNVEKYKCTYADGYVTFVTDHLSYYAVMYTVADGSGAGGFPTVYVAVIIAVAAIVALMAVFFIKKRETQKE